MTKLTDNIFAYSLPNGNYGEGLIIEVDGKHYLNMIDDNGEMLAGTKPLPPGNYRFLFTTKTATEEDARKVVETIHIEEGPSPGNDFAGGWDTGYVDYENRGEFAGYQGDAGVFRKAIESLHSLLRSKGLDDKNNFAIIEKLK